MARMDAGGVAKREQDVGDRCQEHGVVAPRQIGAANRAGKQGIADKQVWRRAVPLGIVRDGQAHAARTMPRCVIRTDLQIAQRKSLASAVVVVDRWRRLEFQAEHPTHVHGAFIEKRIGPVKPDRHLQSPPGGGHAGDVIEVGVGEQDVGDGQPAIADERQQSLDFVSGIDDRALLRSRAGDDEAVLVHRRDRLRLDYDHVVILAIVDDLMFSSKLRNAAKAVGTRLAFARSVDSALAEMRHQKPSLVIFDLNNPRIDALAIVSQMKADPALTAIATIGFTQHTATETIAAARTAGIQDVLARSAFFERLPELMTRQPA